MLQKRRLAEKFKEAAASVLPIAAAVLTYAFLQGRVAEALLQGFEVTEVAQIVIDRLLRVVYRFDITYEIAHAL